MSRKWSWDANAARRMNGCGNPVDREAAVRDTDGRLVPEWRRKALLPPDCRTADDPDSPYLHPENFSPARMWRNYFVGSDDPVRCARLDEAVRRGECVALGAVAGTYSVWQVLSQLCAKRTS